MLDTFLQIADKVPSAAWLAIAAWAGCELRQWRIFVMKKHGGAPDENKEPPKSY